jgi:flavin reductase (DIM6/NTAB) family NADH-FMN oxidoreductase RutF
MRRWATGVAIVTSAAAGRPVGCTVNAFTSVSLDPPLLLVSLGEDSRTLAAIMSHGAFGLSLLGRRQRRVADAFAASGGDHFRDVPFEVIHGVPILAGSIAAAACALEACLPVADHVLLLGAPRWCAPDDDPAAADDVSDDGGDQGGAGPMVFFAGQYLTTSP